MYHKYADGLVHISLLNEIPTLDTLASRQVTIISLVVAIGRATLSYYTLKRFPLHLGKIRSERSKEQLIGCCYRPSRANAITKIHPTR